MRWALWKSWVAPLWAPLGRGSSSRKCVYVRVSIYLVLWPPGKKGITKSWGHREGIIRLSSFEGWVLSVGKSARAHEGLCQGQIGHTALKSMCSCLSAEHRLKLISRAGERQVSEHCARESGLYLESPSFLDSEAAAGFSLLHTLLPFRLGTL